MTQEEIYLDLSTSDAKYWQSLMVHAMMLDFGKQIISAYNMDKQ